MMTRLTADQKEKIVDQILSLLPGVVAIYLYGSEAKDEVRDDSDLDLAVCGDQLYDPIVLWDCKQELAIRLGRDVDLIDISAISTVLKMQVFSTGQRLYGSEAVMGAYESLTYSSYARLNEERAGILNDIRKRGSVYG